MTQILIAEDDPETGRLLAEALDESLAASAEVVANGALVPDALAARRTDLLILDVALPGLNGLDVFDVVRNDTRWHGVPVLFLTSSPERAAAAFSPAGVHRVMAKPFDLDELIGAVRSMTSYRDARATSLSAETAA